MLWVIDSLVYGFFTAIYTLFNQHYKLNGYVLGIWRGFGISLVFMPFLYFFPVPESAYYWFLLIFQGLLIGVYDSHLFFASADFGAGPTSRFMAITALVTTFLWWFLTPEQFEHLLGNGTVFISLILVLFGFTVSYWQMVQSPVSQKLVRYILPAVFALAGMSIATKEIAVHSQSGVWGAITYYLAVALFVSGCYNLFFYLRTQKKCGFKQFVADVFNRRTVWPGIYMVAFSAALITAKTLALRVAPNPGYVTALLLVAPIFVYVLNRTRKIPDDVSVKAGFSMIFFLLLLILLVNGDYGITD